jgi:hypothetical protein
VRGLVSPARVHNYSVPSPSAPSPQSMQRSTKRPLAMGILRMCSRCSRVPRCTSSSGNSAPAGNARLVRHHASKVRSVRRVKDGAHAEAHCPGRRARSGARDQVPQGTINLEGKGAPTFIRRRVGPARGRTFSHLT